MKARNISFAEVLKGKARSPRLDTKQATLTLSQLLQQWQLDPQQDYTLYLGNFKNSHRSKSSTNMFTSRNPTNEDEEMFDSWIQRQSALNANKENVITQPRKYQNYQSHKYSQQQQPPRFAFNSKGNSKGSDQPRAKTLVPEVQHRQILQPLQHCQQPQMPRVNMRHLENIGANIQMIKSNTCQKEDLRRIRSPGRGTEQISLEVQEVDSYQGSEGEYGREIQRSNPPQTQEQRGTASQYQHKLHERRQNEDRSIRQDQEFQLREGNNSLPSEKNQKHKDQINAIIRQTTNIHNEIGDLAKKYVFQDELVQSKQSAQADSEDDQLLIGNSDRKLLAAETQEDQLFGNDYAQKARKEEEIQRQRREEAKMKLNDLMKQYYSKGKAPAFNSQKERDVYHVEGIRVEQANSGVGYSFSSNAFNSQCQKVQNQLKIDQVQQVKSQVPIIAQQFDDLNFRKKYVKEQFSQPFAQPVQNIQSVQYDTYRSIHESVRQEPKIPNQSFETKFIKAEDRSNYSSAQENLYDNVIEKTGKTQITEPSAKAFPTSTTQTAFAGQLGIKVSLNEKKSETDNDLSLNSFSREQEKGATQKIKVVSNQKLKVYSNSNKSSPAVSHSSQERQQKIIEVDVRTKPFVIGGDLQSIAANDKPEPVKKQLKQTEDRCPSPFKSIKEVKESVISCGKSPSPELQKEEKITTPTTTSYQPSNITVPSQKSREYPSYALPSDSHTYQQQSNNQYAFSTKNYQTNFVENNLEPYSNSQLPTYSHTKQYLTQANTYETKETYRTETISYGTFTKTEYSRTQTEVIRNANPPLKTSGQETTYSKYALPSYESKRDSDTRRSYLAELQLKQSINVEEPSKFEFGARGKEEKVGSNSRQVKGILDGHLKQSLKQSIELRSSSEFNFDF